MKPDEAKRPSPTRACAACRERRPAAHLVRFAWDGERVVPDLRRRVRGRGMHLCASRDCLARALKKRAFGRQLRRNVNVDGDALRAQLALACESALTALLRDGRRSGDVTLGGLRHPDTAEGECPPSETSELKEGATSVLSRSMIGDSEKRRRAAWLAIALTEFTSPDAGAMHPAARAGRSGRVH